ncbi:MAG: thioredoxin family protein [Bdellovibrionales bacterium]|nr:thioredoxin family protein [Bdellovibrionales bacterium]
MALVYTPSAKLGWECPPFLLKSVEGDLVQREDFKASKVLVVMFICAHCPYVQAIEDRFISLASSFFKGEVQFIGICSNDWEEYPEDSPENLLHRWKEKNYSFPYLIDSDQSVARLFGAVCTPDIFVFNSERQLTYRGRLDDSWKDASKVRREDLREAIQATLQNLPIPGEQIPSMGCSIKWKA